MTFSNSTPRITRNKSIKRINLSRDGGEHETQKESKSFGYRNARKVKNNQFAMYAAAEAL